MWMPAPIWEGCPCYIVGGGSSLKGFQWENMRGRKVLGCNAAFYLGAELIPITVFGDATFLKQHHAGLERYVKDGGIVVTNCSRLRNPSPPSWLHVMRKELHGLSNNGLGWNGNTGSPAINLALLLGASPIYLLGFDMKLSQDGHANFHNAYSHSPNPKAYKRFLKGMEKVVQDLPVKFPGRKVVNLEDGTSVLGCFPKESLKLHFEKRGAA